MDPDMYFLDNPKERLDAYAFEARAKGCFVDCPMFAACLEWALYRERSGYWAGTTARERVLMRRDLGIVVVEPQYQDFDEDEDEDEFAA